LLRKNIFDADQLAAIVSDYHHAGLTDQDVTVMEFAEKITPHAHIIQKEDIEKLRGHGLTDEEILDVALASSVRNFWSKMTDAMGVVPDDKYLDLEPNVRKAMQKGRPFGG